MARLQAMISDSGRRGTTAPHGPLMAAFEVQRVMEKTERTLYLPGHEGKAHLATTVNTRDYASYGVSAECLAHSLERIVGFEVEDQLWAYIRRETIESAE